MKRTEFTRSGIPKATFIRRLMGRFQGTGIVITARMAENIYNETIKSETSDSEKLKDIMINELILHPPNIRKLAQIDVFNPEETKKIVTPETDEELNFDELEKYLNGKDK